MILSTTKNPASHAMGSRVLAPKKRSQEAVSHGEERWLSVALLVTLLFLMPHAELWAGAMIGVVLLTRTFLTRERRTWEGPLARIAVIGLGVGLLYVQHGTVLGLRPGLSLLLILLAVKVLESKSLRDHRVLIVLGYFMCLAILFFEQTLRQSLFAVLGAVVYTAFLIKSHATDGYGPRKVSAIAWRLLGLGLPLAVLLFLFFPRPSGGGWLVLGQSSQARSGMSDSLNPATTGSMQLSERVSFRVEFGGDYLPRTFELYWRVHVLSEHEGMRWSQGRPVGGHLEDVTQSEADVIQQRIILEPHGESWMPSLDWPVKAPRDAALLATRSLTHRRPVNSQLRYQAGSQFASPQRNLSEPARRYYTFVGRGVSKEARELAERLAGEAEGDQERLLQLLLEVFQEDFIYSLEPGSYTPSRALDQFLFERRIGFCEHYASAFAILARIAGLPSRVIVGYQGGEENPRGSHWVIRDSAAHAWAEVHLAGRGWVRADPTAVIAPSRIASGIEGFLGQSARNLGTGGGFGQELWGSMFRDLGMWWDSFDYYWNIWVLGYNDETQFDFLRLFGLEAINRGVLGSLLVGVSLLVLGVLLKLPARVKPRSRWEKMYRREITRVVPNLARSPAGPWRLKQEARAAENRLGKEWEALAEAYLNLRYGKAAESRTKWEAFRRAVIELRAAWHRVKSHKS
ncbi:MAG: transglutaminaseTgpA domain-containing protein [Verrucomicrobiales bacterium]